MIIAPTCTPNFMELNARRRGVRVLATRAVHLLAA